jgi:signal transduction histidine kinase
MIMNQNFVPAMRGPAMVSEGQQSELRIARELQPAQSPYRRSLGNAPGLLRRVLDEGRAALQGLRAPDFAPTSIEKELSAVLEDFSTSGIRCEISVTGHAKQLKPAVQEQINLIAKEALVNAVLHSQGTCVEIEVEYSARRLRVVVRDNGCGMDPQLARSRRDSHWGLLGMRERAENIGAQLTVWSRPGAGTEVEISVPNQVLQDACA